jgi:hypothetical protein
LLKLYILLKIFLKREKEKMKAFLERTNLFSHTISFNYYKNKVYHSFIGICLSIVMYCLMIYFIIYFSDDFIYRKNPRLAFKETEFNEEKTINYSSLFDQISINLTLETNKPKIKNYLKAKTLLFLNSFSCRWY